MKKKLLSICAVAALGAFTAVGFNLQNTSQLSDVTLANIEAVAGGEGSIIVGSMCRRTDNFICVFPMITDDEGNIISQEAMMNGYIDFEGGDGAYTIPM